jgi:hypothetical protein
LAGGEEDNGEEAKEKEEAEEPTEEEEAAALALKAKQDVAKEQAINDSGPNQHYLLDWR